MATSVVFPRVQFFANNGRPLIGGRIHTYVAGSSTRARTYKDAAKAQPNANPIILDARGEASVYLAEGVEYKFVIEDSTGALIMTQEPVYGAIWPNAAEWPSDTTLSYQYMTEAKAVADATSAAEFYDTYAQALLSAGGARRLVEIARDETHGGSRTRYWAQSGVLEFWVNMDQIRMDLANPSDPDKGAEMVGYIASGSGGHATTVQAWMRNFVLVSDYRNPSDPDDYLSFFRSIAALPSGGGTVVVPAKAYSLGFEPTWAGKSVMWDIDPGATFSGAGVGAGKFPYMNTNPAQMAVGPFIQCRSRQKSSDPNGGIAAFNVEMLQPVDYGAGQSVALYAGARGGSPDPLANVWAINCLIAIDESSKGVYQCIEVDVDTNSTDALCKGISITGGGAANPDVALEITRSGGKWDRGIHIFSSQDAVVISPVSGGRGVIIGDTAPMVDCAISAKQSANGADTIFLHRNIDSSPLGYFIRAVNSANSENIFQVDVVGNMNTIGIMQGANIRANAPALPAAANVLSLGATTSTAAAPGLNGAPPAQVAAYLEFYHGANKYKIPFYN